MGDSMVVNQQHHEKEKDVWGGSFKHKKKTKAGGFGLFGMV